MTKPWRISPLIFTGGAVRRRCERYEEREDQEEQFQSRLLLILHTQRANDAAGCRNGSRFLTLGNGLSS